MIKIRERKTMEFVFACRSVGTKHRDLVASLLERTYVQVDFDDFLDMNMNRPSLDGLKPISLPGAGTFVSWDTIYDLMTLLFLAYSSHHF